MRIALVLDPPAQPMDASAWLWDALRASRVSMVMLPDRDPLVEAMTTALADAPDDPDGVIVIARAATGHVDSADWQRLGFADRARLSGSRTDSAIELALSNASSSRASLDAATLAELHRHQLQNAKTSSERGALWSKIADESLMAATDALQQALALEPNDPLLLQRLQAGFEASGRWQEAVDAKVSLSETVENPRERARAMAAAAGMCARRTNNVPRAVALYEAAIADDPTTPGAFEAIEAVLVRNDDWTGVESAYVRQLERLAGRGETDSEVRLLEKLAALREERLNDVLGAIEALDRLVVVKPEDVEARTRLAALLERSQQLSLALRCLEGAATRAPTRAATFRDLRRVSQQMGDLDRAYSACAVLVHLGEADPDEQHLYQEFAPETTSRPQAPLDAQSWSELAVADHDAAISRIVHIVAPAAIELRLGELRAARRLPELRRDDRHDPEKSTLTAVRTVAWACSVLGIAVPEIHTGNQELPGGIVSLPLPEPTLLLGKSLLAGRSVPELAFATARELASQYLTARLLTFYPSVAEIRALLLAAVAQITPLSLPREALPLRAALASRIDPRRRAELERAIEALHARDGRVDLTGWMRATEIASCRAGLLVCGDVTAAAHMLAVDGRVFGGMSAADRIRDLIPFSISDAYGKLRRTLGVEARRAQPGFSTT